MSETSSRYQNALRYAPGRSVGLYPDARDITQLPVRNVGARSPVVYNPRVTQVATTDPVLLAAPPPIEWQEPAPVPQTGGDMEAPGLDVMGLVARYGPRIANELYKRLRPDDELAPLDGQAWADSLPANHLAYTGFGFEPLPADTGIFMPSFADGVAPVGQGQVVDAMNLTRGGLGFGGDAGADAAGGALDKVAGTGADGSAFLSGIRDALGTGAAAGAVGSQLSGTFGGLSDIAGAGMSALGGWLGTNAAHATYQNNGSPDNINVGAAIGAAIGGTILPVVGAAPGAYIGGAIGGSINPQPDYKQTFGQFSIAPDGSLTGSGIQRNNAGQDVADSLYNNASQYWSDLAAQQGYAPNAAMMNQGFRFGIGQGDNMLGGWFLQPFAGDPNYADVRPDMNLLTVQDPEARARINAEVAATYRPGDNYFFAGGDLAGQRSAEFTRGPQSFQEALDLGFGRLVDLGYYAPAGSAPSPQDVAANIDAQRAWAAANPQQVQGDDGFMSVPWPDQFVYQPGWQAPGAGGGAPQSFERGWIDPSYIYSESNG